MNKILIPNIRCRMLLAIFWCIGVVFWVLFTIPLPILDMQELILFKVVRSLLGLLVPLPVDLPPVVDQEVLLRSVELAKPYVSSLVELKKTMIPAYSELDQLKWFYRMPKSGSCFQLPGLHYINEIDSAEWVYKVPIGSARAWAYSAFSASHLQLNTVIQFGVVNVGGITTTVAQVHVIVTPIPGMGVVPD
jgi:hypothetical protein